jgi:ubiquinone/menaquinone biosynthesis C-methylase UbiE
MALVVPIKTHNQSVIVVKIFKGVTAAEERRFEQENVRAKREQYLDSNPIERRASDEAYREKVALLKAGLGGVPSGLILDLGGNTGGESTVLLQEGFEIVISDINEVALALARERAEKFGLKVPTCVAGDVHALPFADETFDVVMVVEALHHFEDYDAALNEIFRILRPGGMLMAIEPNGWNPLRRLSEIRDRFRGTIEKSFTGRQLRRLLKRAGFLDAHVASVPGGRSKLRMSDVPRYRRLGAYGHAWLQRNCPAWFGSFQIKAFKRGELIDEKPEDWPNYLREPGGKGRVRFDSESESWIGSAWAYPQVNHVPVLIREDRIAIEKLQSNES